eukprot:97655-Pelagomonas_calceolata.AAC.1
MRQLEASTREEAALSCAQAWGVLRVWARDDEGWWCAVIGAAICRDRQDRPYMFGSHTCTAKKLSYDATCTWGQRGRSYIGSLDHIRVQQKNCHTTRIACVWQPSKPKAKF